MEAEEFIESLRRTVLESDLKDYGKILAEDITQVSDQTWRPIVLKYQLFSDVEKKEFINFMRMIQVNTISHVLGVIDGSSYLDENNEDFKLICSSDGKLINGDLQDYFLDAEEGGY